MGAPHRLASKYRVSPEEARAELQSALSAVAGDVRAAAMALGRHESVVHGWVLRWGLRRWLAQAWPAAERARRRGMKGAERRKRGAG